MDAFSISLIYGTLDLSNRKKFILSSIVGIYHFIMPLLGKEFGNFLTNLFNTNMNYLIAIIFLLIGIQMIIESFKKENSPLLTSITAFLIFGLSVSIDSFTTGIGINSINNNHFQVSSIFSITSFLFTYLGLILGNKLTKKLGNIATIIGGSILIILSIIYFLL